MVWGGEASYSTTPGPLGYFIFSSHPSPLTFSLSIYFSFSSTHARMHTDIQVQSHLLVLSRTHLPTLAPTHYHAHYLAHNYTCYHSLSQSLAFVSLLLHAHTRTHSLSHSHTHIFAHNTKLTSIFTVRQEAE